MANENALCSVNNFVNDLFLNALPDEMLLKIFSYLTVEDIVISVCAVCKRWKSLCYERTLWKHMKFICANNMPLGKISNILKLSPLLQVIEMQWRTDVEEIMKDIISSCRNLIQISMVCCGKIRGETLEQVFQNYPFLEYLSLEKCWTVHNNCYEVLHKFTNLKCVNISHSRHFSGDMLRKLVNSCPSLVHINIDYIHNITDDDLLYLIQMKKHNLQSLVLYGESLSDASFCSIDKCSNLKKLHISRCLLMFKKGLQSIGKLTQLRSLKLRFGVNISPEDLVAFLLSKAVRELEYLCLSRSDNFTDNAAMAVAENCIQLRQLDVVYCPNLTETGLQILLLNCRQLKKLNFSEDNSLASEIIVAR